MSKTQETGHKKNVANFETLITFCDSYSTSYNPGSTIISLTALKTMYASALSALDNVESTKAIYNHVTNEREIAFEPVSKLCARVVNTLDAFGASEEKVKDGRSIVHRLTGRRTSKKTEPKVQDANNPTPETHQNIAHLSFDSKVAALKSLIQLLLTEPKYQPNEAELSIGGLTTLVTNLESLNTQVKAATVALSNARVERDNLLYISDNSLTELVQDVKKYIKGVFGAASSNYKQLTSIKFSIMPTVM
jgi:hypothetical protein